MPTLEERIKNLTGDIVGTGQIGAYEKAALNTLLESYPRALSDADIAAVNELQVTMPQDQNPMQPLVDAGFGNEVQVIMQMPMDSPESKAAQRRIIQGMGTGMDIDSFLMEIAKLKGRDGDTTIAHLTEGEIVIPAPVFDANPKAADSIEKTMEEMGIDPRTRMVDSTGQLGGIASINPETGLQEFGFLSKAWKKIKNVGRKVAKVAQFIPGPHQPFAKAVATADSVYSGIKSGNPLAAVASLVPTGNSGGIGNLFKSTGTGGNIFSKIGEYIMPGQDKVGLFGNLAKLPGQIASGIGGLFGGSDIKYDPVNDGYINVRTGLPATAAEIAASTGKGQSKLGYIEDILKGLTGDEGLTRTQELLQAGYSQEEIDAAKANGTFNQLVAEARASGKITGRGLIGGAGNVLGGLGEALGITDDKAGLTGLGNFGLAGLAGLLGKLAYEEAKNQKGVPLTPLTTMDPLGRYNIAAEIARQKGEAMPSRVEYGLTGEGFPALSGGRPTTSEGTIYQPPTPTMAAQGGIMAFAKGGSVAKMNEGGETEIEINIEEFPRKDGQIDGPGTETSDDIPAMLSDGEFVMTAKAVKGAGSFDLQDKNGILTLTPNGDSGRDSGTRLMYKLMDHFSKVA